MKSKKKKTLAETEREVIGFDHCQLGEQVAALWGFPEAVKATIRHHHASVNRQGPHVDIVRCVEVANLICTLKGITSVGVKLVRFSAPVLASLELAREDIAILAEDLDSEFTSNAGLFQI